MKRLDKFLFVYSLLLTTTLTLAAIIFAPKPSNFVLILFIAPVVYYLWLRVATDDAKSKNKGFAKKALSVMVLVLITSAIISAAGIYIYTNTRSNSDPEGKTEKSNTIVDVFETKETKTQELPKDISTQLAEINAELVKLRAEQRGISNILGISSSPIELQEIISDLDDVEGVNVSNTDQTSLGSITVRDNYSRIDAHEEPVASSRVVGSINKGKSYEYFDRNGNWYYITTDQGTKGWVFASFVEDFLP